MKDSSVKSQTIEWLRFVCAALVVLLHSFFSPWDRRPVVSFMDSSYDAIRIFFSQGCCRVAVPIFFLISGYLFFTKLNEWNTKIWLDKVKKRVKNIVIPYFIWNIIAMAFSLFLLYRFWLLKGGERPELLTWFNSIGGVGAFWDAGNSAPYNLPLWFVRNLIVLIAVSPVIYCFVKKTKVYGLIILSILYLTDLWTSIPGFESSGFMFFTLGAFFSINSIDFAIYFKDRLYWLCPIAIVILSLMVVTFGDMNQLWQYLHRLFTFIGSFAMIGLVAKLFEKKSIRVYPFLSNSSFFIYAAHSFILSSVQDIINKPYIPNTQFVLILKYLLLPFITILTLLFVYSLMQKIAPKTLAFITGGR